MTLSAALRAPPPVMRYTFELLLPSSVTASSPTSSHHTFSSVQLPSQCTPSAAGAPMITFLSEPPGLMTNRGSCPSPSPPLPRSPLPTKRPILPSKSSTSRVLLICCVEPAGVGNLKSGIGLLPKPPPVPAFEPPANGSAPPFTGMPLLPLPAMVLFPVPPLLAPPVPEPATGLTCCVPAVPIGGFCPVPALGMSSSSSDWPASPEQAARHT